MLVSIDTSTEKPLPLGKGEFTMAVCNVCKGGGKKGGKGGKGK